MLGLALLVSCYAAPPAPASLSRSERHALQQWPLIPVAPLPIMAGKTPATPVLPLGRSDTDLMNKVVSLAEANPIRSSRQLASDFEHQVLKIHLQVKPGQAGAFAVAKFKTGDQPFMGFDRTWLASVATPDDILGAWLLLAHEQLHYGQWQVADQAHQLTFEVYEDHFPAPLQPDGCVALWEDESAAYSLECAIATQWGRPDLVNPDLCASRVDPAAFKQRVLWIFIRGPTKSEHACIPVWAALAGHPHPEAYEGYLPVAPRALSRPPGAQDSDPVRRAAGGRAAW